MSDIFDKAVQEQIESEGRFAEKEIPIQGVLVGVDSSDTAAVRNQPGRVWCRIYSQEESQPVPVLNPNKVPPFPGRRVIVKRVLQGWEITGNDNSSTIVDADDYTGESPLLSHASTHEPGGGDLLYIYMRAMTMLRCSPVGTGFKVSVPPTNYPDGQGSLVKFPGYNNFDLEAHQPVSGFACLVLVYLDTATNALEVAVGSDAPDTPTIIPAKPAIPEGAIPSAYVRLSGDATKLFEADIIEDTRAFISPLIHNAAKIRGYTVEQGIPANGEMLAYNSVSGEIEWTPLPVASETVQGIIEIATQAEADTGTDDNRAITPLKLKSVPVDHLKVSKLRKPNDTGDVATADNNGDVSAVGDIYAGTTSRGAVQGASFDFALTDKANASGVADHFRQNTSGAPSGWTQVDAAAVTNTTQKYSFWYLRGTSTDTGWRYRRQSSINIESSTSNFWQSFMFEVMFRDGDYTADINYWLGMYRNNAGSIDTAVFSRVHLWWDSANSLWKIRGQESDGTISHNSTAFVTLDQNPLPQPFYFRFLVRNDSSKTCRQYFGTTPVADSHQLLLSVAQTTPQTWGAVWIDAVMSRGAGVEDYMYLGGLDFLENTP